MQSKQRFWRTTHFTVNNDQLKCLNYFDGMHSLAFRSSLEVSNHKPHVMELVEVGTVLRLVPLTVMDDAGSPLFLSELDLLEGVKGNFMSHG